MLDLVYILVINFFSIIFITLKKLEIDVEDVHIGLSIG